MNNQDQTKTILIADDDRFVVTAFKSGLEHAGYLVVTASNGDEALETVRSATPDLILLDLILPKKDGFEVLRIIKADPLLASIHVIVLTNLSQISDEQEVLRIGAADFLVKANVSLNDILLRVGQLLDNMPEPPQGQNLIQ